MSVWLSSDATSQKDHIAEANTHFPQQSKMTDNRILCWKQGDFAPAQLGI